MEWSLTMFTVAWLLINEIALGAGKLKAGVDRFDSSIVKGRFHFKFQHGCLANGVERISDVLPTVQEVV
jgi:hypothetical protein